MANHRKYTDEQFIEAVKDSGSIRQVLSKLGLKEAGGNYACCRDRIKKLKLNTDHFHGMGWSKGKKFGPKRPIDDYLSNKYFIGSHSLKQRLINDGIFKHYCFECKRTKWNNKIIPIELDHIDGNHTNNNLSNLRLLCPNCHAQTANYRGKNKGKY